MSKLLSVVIPTHNRSRYAKFSLLSILELNFDIEIVISDTSDERSLGDFIDGLDLSKFPNVSLVYDYQRKAFDMCGNHNNALSQATSEFVCLIGDDDSVTPYIIDACEWMKLNNVDVLSQLTSVNYIWPDFITKFFGSAHAGRLYIDKELTRLEKVKSNLAFEEAMNRAAQGTDGLPKLYHGIVRRSLLQEIKSKSGKYVHGSSPDFSAAISLSTITSSFYQTTFPITIPGASGGSNTGRSALNKHKGSLADESQTKNDLRLWEKEIPSFFSVETVWADACFKSLDNLNYQFREKFDFFEFYALLLVKHSDSKKEIYNVFYSYIKNNKLNVFISNVKLFLKILKVLFEKMFSILLRLLNPSPARGKFFYSDLDDVQSSPSKVKEYIDNNGVSNIFK